MSSRNVLRPVNPRPSVPPSRRQFLESAAWVAGGALLGASGRSADSSADQRHYRAAIIGRTGGGDYGHGYDQIFQGLGNVTVEAIADADAAGLKRAADRAGAARQYLDYREMLRREKPDLVCVAPRHVDCHPEMAIAASEVCRGIFIEKPLTETLAEADAVLTAAAKRNVKIQVAHNRRYTREFVQAKALLAQGLIGAVRRVQIHGKQDGRAGGEDLFVLGIHDFDLMRFYFGDPLWCQASVSQAGRDITRAEVRRGREPAWVAGDAVEALFAFPGNLPVSWSSAQRADHWNTNFSPREKWAFEILGTKGILAYQSGFGFAWLDSPFFAHKDETTKWQDLPSPANWTWPETDQHPIRSLIHAIEADTAPVCSGADGRWAVAMVAAVYESQRTKARVAFPLTNGENPLLRY